MPSEKAGGYISQLIFNNGQKLDIAKNDIVIFGGPNNAGKSQALKDIYALSKEKVPSIVISDIIISKYIKPISNVLSRVSIGIKHGTYTMFDYLGNKMTLFSNTDNDFPKSNSHGDYRDLFIANLDTSARLHICSPPRSIRRNQNRSHPIQYAAFDSKYRKWLSDSFKKAFDIEITPNTHFGSEIPLCIGKPVQLDDIYEDEQSRQEAYADILATYNQVQSQGDGIKSFTGILLYLMLDYYCTYLIDEPESFLHPPQARIMGQIIGQTLLEQQAFISTHSEDVIKGLLEVCPDRIKIVRITRENNTNHFSILNNLEFKQIWNDPILKYSNIMTSLFHKSVVLCESDSDCKLYSIIENHIKKKEGKYSGTLFIHCGGKHRMSKIIKALRSLNINVKLIADIDVLNDKEVFRGIVESFDVDFGTMQTDYNNIVLNLHSPKEKINRNSAKMVINQVLEGSKDIELSKAEIKSIREAISTISKWEGLKLAGATAIPAGNATASFNTINQRLKSVGVYIVPVGELECFVKAVGGHGPEWVNTVLENYPNLDDTVYNEITNFISSMNL